MESTVLLSTLFLTLLMIVGLFFFIRASVKDRTEVVLFQSEQTQAELLAAIQNYFEQRAYRLVAIDPKQEQVCFEGFVRPSVFLAIFLSLMAGVGTLCLSLVLLTLLPDVKPLWFGLVLMAPLAGWFYWQGAGRTEQVFLKVEADLKPDGAIQNLVSLKAHRDEVAEFQRLLPLQVVRYGD